MGGGEERVHSSPSARQGFGPASAPRFRLTSALYRKGSVLSPRMIAPMVESMLPLVNAGS